MLEAPSPAPPAAGRPLPLSGARRRAERISVAALAFICLTAGAARADLGYRVVVLRPAVADDVTVDALARVRGELTAAGFDVSERAPDPALEVRSALETVGRELDPIAAFAIVRDPGADTAEIWVCDRMAGKSVIQSVRLDAAGAPGQPSGSVVLAVRAVEVLKASLAQYWLASERRRAAASGATTAAAATPPTYVTAGLGLEAGVGWLDNLGAVTAAWQPILRAWYGGARGWAGRLTVTGLGSEATAEAPEGIAQIQQGFGALEIVRGFRAGARLQLVASLGGGAYRARIIGVGTGARSYNGYVTTSWSALAIAGGGLIIPLGPIGSHVALAADAQAALTWPDNIIRVVGTDAGHTGRPALLVSAGALARF